MAKTERIAELAVFVLAFFRWEADHIVPIAEGGSATRDNLRVLCRPCHVRVTAAMRARLAAKRKEKP